MIKLRIFYMILKCQHFARRKNVFVYLTEMMKLRIFYVTFKFQCFASRKAVLAFLW